MSFDDGESPAQFGYKFVLCVPPAAAQKAPLHTPSLVANFFEQGTAALAQGLSDAAGAMFRKSLEAATRSDELMAKISEGERDGYKAKWLKARLTRLKELHVIPPSLAELADVIKDEGDTAIHENELYDKDSAEALQDFAETFLEQVFTLPAQIEQVKKKRANTRETK